MCEDDTKVYIMKSRNGLSNIKTTILGSIKKTDFMELQYVLN